MICCVDTHALIWYLRNDPRLGSEAGRMMDGAENVVVIPTIVLLEMRYLAAKGRISAALAETEEVVRGCPNCVIWPADEKVVRLAPLGLDIHDAIICGSALSYRDLHNEPISIITRDRAIKEWGGLPVVW